LIGHLIDLPETVLLINPQDIVLAEAHLELILMDHALLTSRAKPDLELLLGHQLRQAAIMAAVDIDLSLPAEHPVAYQKDINQGLLARLLTNLALAAIAHALLEVARLADIGLTQQEDLLVDRVDLAVLEDDVLLFLWTLA
jgi:hypothetical protein